MKKMMIVLLAVALSGTGMLMSGCEDSLEFPDQTTTTAATTTTTTSTTTTLPQAATPVFSPAAGAYEQETLTVTIECATPGAEIYYSFGAAGASSASALAAELSIDRSRTITAFAVAPGYQNSQTAAATYELWGWQALGSGVNNDVYSIAFDSSGNLYAGGTFTRMGATNVTRIARWDGSSWEALSNQIYNTVRAVAHDGTNLYIGGDFTSIGGVTARRIAKWNGTSWEALGGGLDDDYVKAIAVDSSGDLYVGGEFNSASGVANTGFIAKWNVAQSTWEALGTGMDDYVNCFAFDDDGNLYAGGGFSSAGGVANTGYLAKWDPNSTAWSSLGGALNDSVDALVYDSDRDYLYVGGDFGTAGGDTNANRIARWDHISWSPLGTGTDNQVKALAVDYYGTVYAGGSFTTANGTISADYIAKWNGISWAQVGSGMEDDVLALAFHGTGSSATLYAGGMFVSSGSAAALRLAKWGKR